MESALIPGGWCLHLKPGVLLADRGLKSGLVLTPGVGTTSAFSSDNPTVELL